MADAGGEASRSGAAVGTWDAWISHSTEETERAGAALAEGLRVGDVIALSGPLGAGKTRLVAGIARGLGWEHRVRSPSYALVHEYSGRTTLIHADLYRLDPAEVESLGLEEQRDRGVLVVEWGERLPAALLDDGLRLGFEIQGGSERMICARLDTAAGRGVGLLDEWSRAVRAAGKALVAGAGGRAAAGRPES